MNEQRGSTTRHRRYDIQLVEEVLADGSVVESRYGPCIELIGGQLIGSCGDLVTKVGINPALGWMELVQLIAGVFDPEALKRVAPNANHDLFTYSMAYGPRITSQIPGLLQALTRDPITRQAVLFIGKPEDGPTSNLPCTETIQFLARKGLLHSVVHMRSWDLCRGLPYDWMMFTGLTMIMAKCLGLQSGSTVVHAGSSHIYRDQADRLPQWDSRRWKFVDLPDEFGWENFVDWATHEVEKMQRGGVPIGVEISTGV